MAHKDGICQKSLTQKAFVTVDGRNPAPVDRNGSLPSSILARVLAPSQTVVVLFGISSVAINSTNPKQPPGM